METFANSKTKIDPAKHVNYANGMVLGADDFSQEFGYLSGRDQWTVRDLVGYGTVCGLMVAVSGEGSPPRTRVHVSPGTALNQQGQMIHLKMEQCAWLDEWLACQNGKNELQKRLGDELNGELSVFVALSYRECLTDDRPIPGEPCRSEEQLMAPSRVSDHYGLELSFDSPQQCEELLLRDFVRGVAKHVTVGKGAGSVAGYEKMEEFCSWVRNSLQESASPETCPTIDFDASPSLSFTTIDPYVAPEYLRAAHRIWVTELRRKLRPNYFHDWCGCFPGVGNSSTIETEDRILLAELKFPVLGGKVNGEVTILEKDRPYLISLRMLQEWLLTRQPEGSGWGGSPDVHDHPGYLTEGDGDVRYSMLGHRHDHDHDHDHDALQGLTDDDHPQYLHRNGSRPMSGDLQMGSNQVTGLSQAEKDGDAVRFEQAVKNGDAATGDLAGNYPAPTVARLQSRPVSSVAPGEDDALIWNGTEWVPGKASVDEGNFVRASDREMPYAIVAAGWFDGNGEPQGQVYNGLDVRTLEPGIYLLAFKEYDFEKLRDVVYIVKGTVWHSNKKPLPRATFEVVDFGREGIVVSLLTSSGEPDVEALGFMVEISAYGKL